MDYSILYKQKHENVTANSISETLQYDLLISAFNESDRVKQIFHHANAANKHWLIFPEYQYESIEIAHLQGQVFDFSNMSQLDEDDIILEYLDRSSDLLLKVNTVAIDITGMLRPYIVFLVRLLKEKKISKVDFIYSEPKNYKKKEDTEFSLDYIDIREIKGCSGSHNPETNNDLLILGSGYDYHRILRVAKEKKEAKKIQVLGFPSLHADMFQQNILKSYKAAEDASSGEFDLESDNIILAPANDPFVTADLIQKYVSKETKKRPYTNLYICPLATKAQALGMALYYSMECLEEPASIIFPFCNKYSRQTSLGISKYWTYTVEFVI